jgi:hypothetical protein
MYLGGNILAYSQKQALLVDTAGVHRLQYDFETMFGGSKGTPAVQIFTYEDNVFSVFALGNKMVIFRDGKMDSQIALDSEDIEVMHMIEDSPKS